MGKRMYDLGERAPAGRPEDRGCWRRLWAWLRRWLCCVHATKPENEADVERGELEPLRSALEEKEEELRQKELMVLELRQENQRMRSALKEENLKMRELHQVNHRLRSAREEKNLRITEQHQANQRLRFCLEEKEEELRKNISKVMELHQENQLLSSLNQKYHMELNDRIDKLDGEQLRLEDLSQENQQLRSALGQKDTELQRSRQSKKPQSCQRCEHQASEHNKTMSEMEEFYKDKLTKSRSDLKEKDELLRSLKDRLAQSVVLSRNTENTENMDSPVNQSRLTEMYHQLRVCTWPNISLTSSDKQARQLVQEMFTAAAEHMKRATESVRGLKAMSPKVEKFRQNALENLQLVWFHSGKLDVFQAAFPHFDRGDAEIQLASECYWLGCLMVLHSPPLHPHWDSAEAESGTVFPRELRSQRRPNK